MHESIVQLVVWWGIHIFLLIDVMIKARHRVPEWLALLWRGVYSRFNRLTPRIRGVSPTLLAQSLEYLVKRERVPIVVSGLALNAMGMSLAVALPSFLYLDMVGTAFAAVLLGPWYGAIVACLSSMVVHPLLFSETQAPAWMMVNVVGGLYWGVLASLPWFRQSGDQWGPRVNTKIILVGGVLAALVTAFPGMIIQLSLGGRYVSGYSLNPTFASALADMTKNLSDWLTANLGLILNGEFGLTGPHVAVLLVNFVRYTPDKVLTFLVAILFIRVVYPIHWNQLIQSRSRHARVLKQPRQPVLFLLVLAFAIGVQHLIAPPGNGKVPHTPGKSIMCLGLIVLALICRLLGGTSEEQDKGEVLGVCRRAEVYKRCELTSCKMLENRFDTQGPMYVILVVVTISVAVLGIVGAILRFDAAMVGVISTTCRGMMAVAAVAIFLLKFAETALRQQAVLPEELPKFKHLAKRIIGSRRQRKAGDPEPMLTMPEAEEEAQLKKLPPVKPPKRQETPDGKALDNPL